MIFANAFTLAGAEGTFAPGVYVVETMAALPGAGLDAHHQGPLVTLTRHASHLFASDQRMVVEASQLEAALARDRKISESKS